VKEKDIEKMTAKELHVLYVLDTSGSMAGEKIAALNDAMRSTRKELENINKTQNDADFKIGVLQFDDDAKWVTVNSNNEPVVQDIEDFYWNDLEAGGLTSLGDALNELNKQLSRNYIQHAVTGNKRPVIIFMSDGAPTQPWESALASLENNLWYQQAIKIAFALGDGADTDVLARVVGTGEAVIKVSELERFKRMIKIVSVTSALAASQSQNTEMQTTGKQVIKNVLGKKANNSKGGVTTLEGTEEEGDVYKQNDPNKDDPNDTGKFEVIDINKINFDDTAGGVFA